MTLRIQLGCEGTQHPNDHLITKCYDCCGGSPGEWDVPAEFLTILAEALGTTQQENVIDQIESSATVPPCPVKGARRYLTYTVYGNPA